MTPKQIAARLRALADQQHTFIWRELYALARDIEDGGITSTPAPEGEIPASDMEALVRATQPSSSAARVTPLTVARSFLRRRRP